MGINFSIKFPIKAVQIIEPESKIFLVGSCFTENIGNKLNQAGFQTLINPFGILFNPISIGTCLQKIIGNVQYQEDDLLLNHENRYVSFDHHGSYSGNKADVVISQINKSISEAHLFLMSTDFLIITLGSAWVYNYLKQNRIVANCHKVPAYQFEKQLLEVMQISDVIQEVINTLKEFNPNLKILFTISPVKHLRDGVIENQRSKATLILALNQILNKKNNWIHYFAAYEIVTDELRDYRFYETDHAHPNQVAIDYIWERFIETFFTPSSIEKIFQVEKLIKALGHKTLHTDYLKENNLKQRILAYLDKYPF